MLLDLPIRALQLSLLLLYAAVAAVFTADVQNRHTNNLLITNRILFFTLLVLNNSINLGR